MNKFWYRLFILYIFSYLQPKLSNDDEVEDSSSFESDSNETVEPFRLKKMMVSVNRLTNKSIIHQNPRIRFAFPDSLEQSSTEKICGFSNEISEKTFSKNEQLKNIIRKVHILKFVTYIQYALSNLELGIWFFLIIQLLKVMRKKIWTWPLVILRVR